MRQPLVATSEHTWPMPLSQAELLVQIVQELKRLNGEVPQREAALQVVQIPAPAVDLTPVVEAIQAIPVAERQPDYTWLLERICVQLISLNAKETTLTLPASAPITVTVSQQSSLEWLWNKIKELFNGINRR